MDINRGAITKAGENRDTGKVDMVKEARAMEPDCTGSTHLQIIKHLRNIKHLHNGIKEELSRGISLPSDLRD